MANQLHAFKEAIKGFQLSKEMYHEAVIASDTNTGEIKVYSDDKLDEAKERIDETIGITTIANKMLEKDSNRHKTYEDRLEELEEMRERIKQVKQMQ